MKKKAKVAANRTPKVRRAKRVETANEIDVLDLIDSLLSDDLCMELEMELYRDDGKLSPLEKSCAEKIGLLYRVAHGFNKSNSCYRVHEAWREEGRQLAKSLCEWQAAPKPLLAPPKDDVAGVQPATPNPSPAKITPPTPAPIAPRCPHGLARGFFAMCEPRQCEYPQGHQGYHTCRVAHLQSVGNWLTGHKWDRILVNGVWTRP